MVVLPKETSIGLSKKTKEKLRNLKAHERESFEEVIERLIGEQKKEFSDLDLEEAISFLRKRGAETVKVFGSYAKDNATSESDIDIIVDKIDGSLLDLVGMQIELSGILGVEVDLFTENSLHPLLKDDIEREAKVITNAQR